MPEIELRVPDRSLIVLVGATGSGKTTFARTHFRPSQVLSSDQLRAAVSDDENNQAATADAFEVLHLIADRRLARARLTVVDATNVLRRAREPLLRLAKTHNLPAVAVVLDLPEELLVRRAHERTDRRFGDDAVQVVRQQRAHLHAGLAGLEREGFRQVYVLRTPEEIDAAVVRPEPLPVDRRWDTGPFDVIGDVHGCRAELVELLQLLGWQVEPDPDGRPVCARHPQGRTAVFVGDLVDRGPDTPGVLRLVMGMVEAGTALAVCGNHDDRLARALRGRNVKRAHGLAASLEQLAQEPPEFRARVERFCSGLVSHYVLDRGRLVVAHAGLPEDLHGRDSRRVRSFALYGATTGEVDEYGFPVRLHWENDYRGQATVLYGHTPTPEPQWVNRTLCLDTGCVFGGRLTALRYPEREMVSVPAHAVWHEHPRFRSAAP